MQPVAIVIIALVIALLMVLGIMGSRYQKVAPNEVLVIAGRKHQIKENGVLKTVGHRVVKGGGTFVWPVVEKVSKLSLNAMTIDVSNEDAYTKEGVPVIVDSVVIMKIGGDDVSIASAAERFLVSLSDHRLSFGFPNLTGLLSIGFLLSRISL